jgi:nucleoside-diphosphate-sugar epimerase
VRRVHVLVTGAAGFLGRHAVRRLLDRGDTVTGVDRLAIPAGDGSARHLVEDVTAAGGRWRAVAAQVDAVLHLAARPGVRSCGTEVEADRARDILGTTTEVLTTTPPSTAVVVTSSSAVYGEAPPDRGSAEGDPLRPLGSYGRWKVAVEDACARRRERGGLVSVARPFTVAGPGQRPDMAVARWLDAVLAGRPVQVLGGLDRGRDVSDVDDVVTGLVALLDAGARDRLSCTVNLGAGAPRSHAEVLDAVARVTGRAVEVEIVPAHPADPVRTHADPSLAERLLGLVPRTDLDTVVARQLAARLTPAAA